MKNYNLVFSNSNNVWYTLKEFYGTEIDMLKYASTLLYNKENKFYNLWIKKPGDDFDMYMDYVIGGRFTRSKKLSKLIKIEENMVDLIAKYEKEIKFLNKRLNTAIFIGDTQKIRIDTEKEVYLNVVKDLKKSLEKLSTYSSIKK